MEDIGDLREIPVLSLAYYGDSVWEVFLRGHFLKLGLKVNDLNKKVKNYVNAKKQSKIYLSLKENLEEEAGHFAKRGRNCKIRSFPRSCTQLEYRNSTAFETLIGYYYLMNQTEKIKDIVKKYVL